MPDVTIDGRRVRCPDGTTVLMAATRLGIALPALCHDPRLVASGACRLCLVDIEGRNQPVPACTTAIADAMVVHTQTSDIRSLRRGLLAMLTEGYPAEAIAAGPEESFHRLLAEYDVHPSGESETDLVDASHPLIHVDLNRCISCWRCVQICDEVQGQFTWQIAGRGIESRVTPDSNGMLATSSCVSCGACVDTCPTAALTDAHLPSAGHPTQWTRTTCSYCGVGCELSVGTRAGRITQIRPALDAPVNRGHLCVKGRYGFGFVGARDRITTPMVKDADGEWTAASWEDAIRVATTQFRRIVDLSGPSAVGVLSSARVTNEENYLVQKFARIALHTNNIDCCARVCHAPSSAALHAMFGTGAATNSFDDIEAARTILVCGSDTTVAHPIVGARIKQAVLRGSNLIVIDPRLIELAQFADVHLRPRPGTNVVVFNSIAAAIVDEGLEHTEFIADRVTGYDQFCTFIRDHAPERTATITGLAASDVRRAARMYARQGPAVSFHGLGVTEHTQGTAGVMALANLALLTGNLGRSGTGCNPLRGQNNVQGAAVMGCDPKFLTGSVPIDSGHERFSTIWGAPVPRTAGLDAMEMLDAASTGSVRGLWVVGWDILLTQPQTAAVRRALAALDVVVVQDLFMTETARQFGTVFLPAASTFEKSGTFMSAERRVQRVRAVTRPPANAKPDSEIICLAGAAFGKSMHFTYSGAEDVWDEIRRVWPASAGMTYGRLDRPGGLQWPCPGPEHPGTPILHRDTFGAIGARASLRQIDHRPSLEETDAEFPLILITGRTLAAFNSGTMTARSAAAAVTDPTALDISDEDARHIDVGDGDVVSVRSRYGEVELPCRISDRMSAGTVFTTFHSPDVAVNSVVGPGRDPTTHTPEYKHTAVQVNRCHAPADQMSGRQPTGRR